MPQTIGGAGDEEVLQGETSPMPKDHLVTLEITHASSAVNKDILPVIALRGNNAITTTPTSSILMTIVMVDESVREEDGSNDEEKDEDIESIVCQLLNQRTVSQRRDKSCAPSH